MIDAPFEDPDVEPRAAQLQATLSTDPDFAGASLIQSSPNHDVALITVPTSHLPESEFAHDAVRRLRDVHIPEILDGTSVDVLVTGGAAHAVDYLEVVESYVPYVVAIVLIFNVLSLLITTRSVVFPFLATIAHLLSLAAAYGIVVIAIQQGIGAGLGLLRYHHIPTIESWGVVLTFTLMFGVYVVLDLYQAARIREKYVQTDDSIEAVTYGLRSTAWVSTVASLVMVGVFFVLALGDLPVFPSGRIHADTGRVDRHGHRPTDPAPVSYEATRRGNLVLPASPELATGFWCRPAVTVTVAEAATTTGSHPPRSL